MRVLIAAVIFILAYQFLDRDSLLRKIILIFTGITVGLGLLSLFFAVLNIVVYVCIVAILVCLAVGLFKRVFGK